MSTGRLMGVIACSRAWLMSTGWLWLMDNVSNAAVTVLNNPSPGRCPQAGNPSPGRCLQAGNPSPGRCLQAGNPSPGYCLQADCHIHKIIRNGEVMENLLNQSCY